MFARLAVIALLNSLTVATPANSPQSCGSLHPVFALEPFTLSSWYSFQSPSTSGPKAGTVSFTFNNDQVGYTAKCEGVNSNAFGIFYSDQFYDCTTPDPKEWRYTRFSFDSGAQAVRVNTSWDCSGNVVYVTSGTGTIDLDCETNTYTNSDWHPGQVYSNTSTICSPGTLVIQL